LSSTRIEPSLALLATEILVPVATGLGDGAGLAAAVEGDEPPQAAVTSAAPITAYVARSFDRTPFDTEAGYEWGYSGVT
jgi:hypothetical protein